MNMDEIFEKYNTANYYRTVGLLKEANELYQQVKSFYDANISPDSMLFASLFNDMSLLFQEIGDYESACDCQERALGITLLYPECRTEQAITYSNLATTYSKLDRRDDAITALEKSIELFEEDDAPDNYYVVALSAMAELKYNEKQYKESVNNYEKALSYIEKQMGKGTAYEMMLTNLNVAEGNLKNELIDKIVKLEWEAFDKVINEGGRAGCQDDWITFSIMRKSQYMLWSTQMLESFIDDFERAAAAGWNLITEKYGRMEESTAPEEYAKIKDILPPISEDKKQIIEAIVAIQVDMMEEFAKLYPKAAYQARSIHTSEDNPYNTSYETYLRGEISTYSDRTLELYGRFVAQCAQDRINIAQRTIENSAHMYGYESVVELESKL